MRVVLDAVDDHSLCRCPNGVKVGWQYDDESASCMCCDKEFTVLRRRHHCRYHSSALASKR